LQCEEFTPLGSPIPDLRCHLSPFSVLWGPHANRWLPRYRLSRPRKPGRKFLRLQLANLRAHDMPMPPVLHSALWLRGYRISEFQKLLLQRFSRHREPRNAEPRLFQILGHASCRSTAPTVSGNRKSRCQHTRPLSPEPDAPIHDPWDLLPRVPTEING
jgi:hypothetical protein